MLHHASIVCLLVQLCYAQNNIHVDFGDVESCLAPPAGSCGDFRIRVSDVASSLKGFQFNGEYLVSPTANYYGNWWMKHWLNTSTEVPTDFCSHGAGVVQTAVKKDFTGVLLRPGPQGSSLYRLSFESTPHHDIEDYCSAQGSHLPPFIGTNFGITYNEAFSTRPSSRSRSDIANEVGVAVNGVVIFSPFTHIGTVAAYDETLDTCLGHPANGKYHYHGFSPCIHDENSTQTGNSIPHSGIYGWAYDGFPIYGPYGHADGNDLESPIVRVQGSYRCTTQNKWAASRQMGQYVLLQGSNRTECSTDEERAVKTNWAFDEDSGSLLDECNGRWTKTPEFPDGMYVYVLNVQENGRPGFPGVPYCKQSRHSQAGGRRLASAEETSGLIMV